jgi:hypothetical protein
MAISSVGHIAHSPESLIGLGKESQAAKLIQQPRLEILEFCGFDLGAVVVKERDEQIIFLHR